MARLGVLNVSTEFKCESGTVVWGNDGGDDGSAAPMGVLLQQQISDKRSWGVPSTQHCWTTYDDDNAPMHV